MEAAVEMRPGTPPIPRLKLNIQQHSSTEPEGVMAPGTGAEMRINQTGWREGQLALTDSCSGMQQDALRSEVVRSSIDSPVAPWVAAGHPAAAPGKQGSHMGDQTDVFQSTRAPVGRIAEGREEHLSPNKMETPGADGEEERMSCVRGQGCQFGGGKPVPRIGGGGKSQHEDDKEGGYTDGREERAGEGEENVLSFSSSSSSSWGNQGEDLSGGDIVPGGCDWQDSTDVLPFADQRASGVSELEGEILKFLGEEASQEPQGGDGFEGPEEYVWVEKNHSRRRRARSRWEEVRNWDDGNVAEAEDAARGPMEDWSAVRCENDDQLHARRQVREQHGAQPSGQSMGCRSTYPGAPSGFFTEEDAAARPSSVMTRQGTMEGRGMTAGSVYERASACREQRMGDEWEREDEGRVGYGYDEAVGTEGRDFHADERWEENAASQEGSRKQSERSDQSCAYITRSMHPSVDSVRYASPGPGRRHNEGRWEREGEGLGDANEGHWYSYEGVPLADLGPESMQQSPSAPPEAVWMARMSTDQHDSRYFQSKSQYEEDYTQAEGYRCKEGYRQTAWQTAQPVRPNSEMSMAVHGLPPRALETNNAEVPSAEAFSAKDGVRMEAGGGEVAVAANPEAITTVAFDPDSGDLYVSNRSGPVVTLGPMRSDGGAGGSAGGEEVEEKERRGRGAVGMRREGSRQEEGERGESGGGEENREEADADSPMGFVTVGHLRVATTKRDVGQSRSARHGEGLGSAEDPEATDVDSTPRSMRGTPRFRESNSIVSTTSSVGRSAAAQSPKVSAKTWETAQRLLRRLNSEPVPAKHGAELRDQQWQHTKLAVQRSLQPSGQQTMRQIAEEIAQQKTAENAPRRQGPSAQAPGPLTAAPPVKRLHVRQAAQLDRPHNGVQSRQRLPLVRQASLPVLSGKPTQQLSARRTASLPVRSQRTVQQIARRTVQPQAPEAGEFWKQNALPPEHRSYSKLRQPWPSQGGAAHSVHEFTAQSSQSPHGSHGGEAQQPRVWKTAEMAPHETAVQGGPGARAPPGGPVPTVPVRTGNHPEAREVEGGGAGGQSSQVRLIAVSQEPVPVKRSGLEAHPQGKHAAQRLVVERHCSTPKEMAGGEGRVELKAGQVQGALRSPHKGALKSALKSPKVAPSMDGEFLDQPSAQQTVPAETAQVIARSTGHLDGEERPGKAASFPPPAATEQGGASGPKEQSARRTVRFHTDNHAPDAHPLPKKSRSSSGRAEEGPPPQVARQFTARPREMATAVRQTKYIVVQNKKGEKGKAFAGKACPSAAKYPPCLKVGCWA